MVPYNTCKVVFSVSMGVINILQSPADIDAAPVFAAIGISYGWKEISLDDWTYIRLWGDFTIFGPKTKN